MAVSINLQIFEYSEYNDYAQETRRMGQDNKVSAMFLI